MYSHALLLSSWPGCRVGGFFRLILCTKPDYTFPCMVEAKNNLVMLDVDVVGQVQ